VTTPTAPTDVARLIDEVRRIEIWTRHLVTGVLAGGYLSVFRGPGLEFDEVREYVEGDDPRSVDWNVSARVGRPFVKKFLDERELTLLFLLDLSPSMDGGYAAMSARDAAARLVACLALSAVKNNDKVGLVAFGEKVEKYVPALNGASHALRIVRDCLALRTGAKRTDIAGALEFASHVLRRRTILFLVSDFLSTGYREAMTLCARRHDLVAVRLLAPELVPPAAAMVRQRDPESGRETVVDWRSRRVRDEYGRRVAAWRERTREDVRRARVDLLDVPLPIVAERDAVVRPLIEFFRMRELRSAKR
jgi:uncharacterized protein (DUF58 family)